MTFKKPTRAGLLALALGVLFALFLSMSAIDRTYAEEAAAPAAAADAAPPACAGNADPKLAVLEKCTPNAGDTAWMMTSVALVLLMTIPGLGLFYGGMVRKKNVGDTVMTSFAVTCLVSILWLICTYSLAFRAGTPFIGGLDRAFLQGIVSDIAKGIGNPNPLAPTIPETVYICFQMTFAIITPALIAGAFAERMKFSAMLWFIGLWAIFVYAPVAHWVWGPDGFMNAANSDGLIKVLDFAGGTVVHINSGVAGLMACIVLGKRKETGPGHNMVMTMIGASLLWVGWFGFNAGSNLEANGTAALAMINTFVATAGAAVGWLFIECAVKGKPSMLGMVSGAVAGLVAVTPAAGFAGPMGSILLGIVAGVVCFVFCSTVKNALGYDDSLDVFGIHCVGGIIGAIATGILVNTTLGGAGIPDYSTKPGELVVGAYEFGPAVMAQVKAVLFTLVFSGVGSAILYKIHTARASSPAPR